MPPSQAKVTFVAVQQSEFVPSPTIHSAFLPEQAMVFVPQPAGGVVETPVLAGPGRARASIGTARVKKIALFILIIVPINTRPLTARQLKRGGKAGARRIPNLLADFCTVEFPA